MHPRTDTVRRPELWGGVECTVNRVGDEYFDQLERSGHASRIGDLDLFAGLGVTTMRYPVLWERTVRADGSYDWSWPDERLGRLRELGIRPIVGLVHHGSGPPDTGLLDPLFPEKLAAFAAAVAERYPWIDHYTPVNEPLTTARFSALYGLWYPHLKSNSAFARALVNQCRGVILSMRAIRRVNPAALLVQTEDLGKIYSTPPLAYQARFENARRWLTFDLLGGRVDSEHYLWRFLTRRCSLEPEELEWFVENALPPDIIGINHYLTSERFLDDRLEHYPAELHGGNRRHRYADVEAVRVLPLGVAGPERLLEETWERYGLPIAVTEVHLGCTREQQMRWFIEVWDAACRLRGRGVDLRAVTAWSLLGAFDWNSLLTADRGHYESGIFDLRGGEPRATALADVVSSIARQQAPPHLVCGPRWWRQPERLIYPEPGDHPALVHRELPALSSSPVPDGRPLLICGARGRVGRAFVRICRQRGLAAVALGRAQLDIADRGAVEATLAHYLPWGVINAAGYVHVDDAEYEAERCHRENTWGAAILAGACAQAGIPMLGFSTDLVFNGETDSPYRESDRVDPLSVYGRSKADSEYVILRENQAGLVIRTGALLDPWNGVCFIAALLRQLQNGGRVQAASDLTISPTYLPDMVNGALDLLIDGASGIWHLANRGVMTWAELGRAAATMAGLDPSGVIAIPTSDLGLRARRPSYSALGSERGALLPSVEEGLSNFVAARMALSDAEMKPEMEIELEEMEAAG